MRQRLLKHFGLERPYRFERTLVVVTSLALAVVVAVIALYLHARGQLPTGTPRAWYIAYLIGLAALALALAPFPRLAAVVLSLAALEAGFGFGALALYKYRLIPSPTLTPSADDGRSTRFAWHPLLQVLPVASQSSPLTWINSERRRGREWSAEELRGKILVALFGGSTTFEGLTVEGETWADRLQAVLPANYAIANHGMDGFTSAENVIQTAFYERTKGVPPRCAIYFAGANDLRNAHIRNLDPAYADFHLPNQVDAFRIRRGDVPDSISPLVIFLGRILGTTLDTMRPAVPRGEISGSPDPAVEEAFSRNVAAISAINRQRGIRTIWIAVLLNRHELTTEAVLQWAPFVRRKDLPMLVQRLNAILEREAAAAGDVYVEFPPGPFERGGFRDHVHFSEAGSLLFATLLAPTILENCGPR
jgi:lysophospholipase L1-like esterase